MPAMSYEETAREYFHIGAGDLEALGLLGLLMQDVRDRLIDDLYDAIGTWKDASDVIATVDLLRAKDAQKQYFEELFSGKLGPDYIARRARIGSTHDRLNIRPMWYMAAYAFYLLRLFEHVIPRLQGRSVELHMRSLGALTKMVLFDVALAWEAYVASRDQRIHQAESAMIVQQNLIVAELTRTSTELAGKLESWAHVLDSVLEPPPISLGPIASVGLMRIRSEIQSTARELQGRAGS